MIFLLISCQDEEVIQDLDLCSDFSIELEVRIIEKPDFGLDNGAIEVNATGINTDRLQYSLDDTLYQELNRFTGLSAGMITIFARSENDCKSSVSFPVEGHPPVFSLTVVKGSGSGEYQTGSQQSIQANPPEVGMAFDSWIGDTEAVNNVFSSSSFIVMPENDVEVEATYNLASFSLTIIKGTGGGNFEFGSRQVIKADKPVQGMVFDKWIGDTTYVENPVWDSTFVTIPASNIQIEATYREKPIEFTVSYSQEVMPLFDANCTINNCHTGNATNEPDLTTYENQVKHASAIRAAIFWGTMPFFPGELTDEERELIIAWIDEGTPNN